MSPSALFSPSGALFPSDFLSPSALFSPPEALFSSGLLLLFTSGPLSVSDFLGSGVSPFVFTSPSSTFLPLILFQSFSPLSPMLTKKFLTLPINPSSFPSSATALVKAFLPTAILKPTYAAANKPTTVPIIAGALLFFFSAAAPSFSKESAGASALGA